MTATACPRSADLQSLLVGEMSAEESSALLAHLEACGACSEIVRHGLGQEHLAEAMARAAGTVVTLPRGMAVDEIVSRLHLFTALNQPTTDTTAFSDSGSIVMEAPESAPATFGRYRVVQVLGAGGMGTVYKAVDPQLQRTVAIKVPTLPANKEGSDAVARFLREARLAAAVTHPHPHICPIHDVGEHQGKPFVVMAWIDGPSLAQRLQQGRLDDRAAVSLVAKVARALEVIHQHGIVHRDLKPGNILLNSASEPLLTDFGLARPVAEDSRLTHAGMLLGTPAYMAPEQARGDEDAQGPATDLYSLGVVLYQLLTGRLPFEGKNHRDLLNCVAEQAPPPPSRHRPDLDPRLEPIVLQAMAKEPRQRFASAGAFADALAAWLEAPAPGPIEKAASLAPGRPPARRRGPLVAALCLVALLVPLGVWVLPQIVIRITGKDGKENVIPVPRDAGVTIEKDGKPVARVEPDRDTPTKEAGSGKDRKPGSEGKPPRVSNAMSSDALVQDPPPLKGARSWTIVPRLPLHSQGVLAFSPDGRWLASSTDLHTREGEVRLWDLREGTLAKVFYLPAVVLDELGFSHDSRLLAARSGYTGKPKVTVLEMATGKQLVTLEAARFSWSPRETKLATCAERASGSRSLDIGLHTFDRGKITSEFIPNGQPFRSIAWAPDGNKFATQGWARDEGVERDTMVWDVAARKAVAQTRAPAPAEREGLVEKLTWSPDSTLLAFVGTYSHEGDHGYRTEILVWDFNQDRFLSRENHSRVGDFLLTAKKLTGGMNLAERIVSKQIVGETVLSVIRKPSDAITQCVLSPDGSLLAEARRTEAARELLVQETATGKPVHTFPGHPHLYAHLSLSADGSFLASETWLSPGRSQANQGQWSVWDFKNATVSHRLPGALASDRMPTRLGGVHDRTLAAKWSPNGKLLAFAGRPNGRVDSLVIWDRETGKYLVDGDPPVLKGLSSFAWTADSEKLVLGYATRKAVVWHVKDQRVVHTFPESVGARGITCSPDGAWIAEAATDQQGTHVWDGMDYKLAKTVNTKDKIAGILQWSPRGAVFPRQDPRAWPDSVGFEGLCFRQSTTALAISPCLRFSERLLGGGRVRLLWRLSDGEPAGSMVALDHEKWFVVSPDGHVHGTPDIEKELVYVIQTDRGQETLSSEEFAKRFGWKNDPARAWRGLVANPPPAGQPNTPEKGKKGDAEETLLTTSAVLVTRPAALPGVEKWDIVPRLPYDRQDVVALSPDGRWLAWTDAHRVRVSLRLWDLSKGTQARVIQVSQVGRLGFSHDGQFLAVGMSGNHIMVLEVATGKEVATLDGGPFSWSPRGWKLATCIEQGAGTPRDIILYSLGQEKIRTQTIANEIEFNSIQWSPDGGKLATLRKNGEVKVWDAAAGKVIASAQGANPPRNGNYNPRNPRSLAWAADSKLLAFEGGVNSPTKEEIHVWDVERNKVVAVVPTAELGDFLLTTKDLSAARDGPGLVSSRELAPDTFLTWVKRRSRGTSHAQFSADGTRLVEVTDRPSVSLSVRDSASDRELHVFAGHPLLKTSLALSPDGSRLLAETEVDLGRDLISQNTRNQWTIWDVARGTPAHRFEEMKTNYPGYQPMAWSPDGRMVAFVLPQVSTQPSSLVVWDTVTRTDLIEGKRPNVPGFPNFKNVTDLAWTVDSEKLVLGFDKRKVLLWNVKTGKDPHVFQEMDSAARVLCSPDGAWIAAGDRGNKLCVWSARDFKLAREWEWSPPAPTRKGERMASMNLCWAAPDWVFSRSGSRVTVTRVGFENLSIGSFGRVTPCGRYHLRGVGSPPRLWRYFSLADGKLAASVLFLDQDKWLVVSPEGHLHGSPGIENELLYIAHTAEGQESMTAAEFAQRFKWKNDPRRAWQPLATPPPK